MSLLEFLDMLIPLVKDFFSPVKVSQCLIFYILSPKLLISESHEPEAALEAGVF